MRLTPKALILLAGLALMLGSCASYLVTGQHVPIEGSATPEAKARLAKQVLAALPEAEVRARVKARFPQLTQSQLEHIHVSYARMFLYADATLQKLPGEQVHLVVEVEESQEHHLVTEDVEKFVAALLREELKRQSHR